MKKLQKTIVAVLLFVFVLALLPVNVHAELLGDFTIVYDKEAEKLYRKGGRLDGSEILSGTGILETYRFSCKDDTLTLSGTWDFNTSAAVALEMPAGSKLVIAGDITLTATGSKNLTGKVQDGNECVGIYGAGSLTIDGNSPPGGFSRINSLGVYAKAPDTDEESDSTLGCGIKTEGDLYVTNQARIIAQSEGPRGASCGINCGGYFYVDQNSKVTAKVRGNGGVKSDIALLVQKDIMIYGGEVWCYNPAENYDNNNLNTPVAMFGGQIRFSPFSKDTSILASDIANVTDTAKLKAAELIPWMGVGQRVAMDTPDETIDIALTARLYASTPLILIGKQVGTPSAGIGGTAVYDVTAADVFPDTLQWIIDGRLKDSVSGLSYLFDEVKKTLTITADTTVPAGVYTFWAAYAGIHSAENTFTLIENKPSVIETDVAVGDATERLTLVYGNGIPLYISEVDSSTYVCTGNYYGQGGSHEVTHWLSANGAKYAVLGGLDGSKTDEEPTAASTINMKSGKVRWLCGLGKKTGVKGNVEINFYGGEVESIYAGGLISGDQESGSVLVRLGDSASPTLAAKVTGGIYDKSEHSTSSIKGSFNIRATGNPQIALLALNGKSKPFISVSRLQASASIKLLPDYVNSTNNTQLAFFSNDADDAQTSNFTLINGAENSADMVKDSRRIRLIYISSDPTITAQPQDAEGVFGYEENSLNLSVTAATAKDNVLSYQWYISTDDSNATEEDDLPLSGATDAAYSIPRGGYAGIRYYYCVVSSSYRGGEPKSLKTDSATVTIKPSEITMVDETITAPIAGAAPQMKIDTAGDLYTARQIIWSPSIIGNKFASGTVYTASVTLTPLDNHKFTASTAAAAFDADKTLNQDGSLTLSKTFKPTSPSVALNGDATLKFNNTGGTATPTLTVSGIAEGKSVGFSLVETDTDNILTLPADGTLSNGTSFSLGSFAVAANAEGGEKTASVTITFTDPSGSYTSMPKNITLTFKLQESNLSIVQRILPQLKIPSTFFDSNRIKLINEAKAALGSLTPEQKLKIPAEELSSIEGTLEDELVQFVIDAINAIGTFSFDAECEQRIKTAKDAYDDLTDAQKDLVTNKAKLEQAVSDLAAAKENHAKANAVIDKINSIGTVGYNSASEQRIKAAQDAYDNLTDAQKALVTNKAKLEQAVSDFAAAKENHTKANAVIDKIDSIGTVSFDTASEQRIKAAQDAYDDLTPAQKALVTNKAKLEQAVSDFAAAKENRAKANAVIDKIDSIGSGALKNASAIRAARAAYDALTPAQKALVDNFNTLKSFESELAKAERDQKIKLELGALSLAAIIGAIRIIISVIKALTGSGSFTF